MGSGLRAFLIGAFRVRWDGNANPAPIGARHSSIGIDVFGDVRNAPDGRIPQIRRAIFVSFVIGRLLRATRAVRSELRAIGR